MPTGSLVQGLVREISGATICLEAGLSRVMQRFWKRQSRSSTSIRVFGKGDPVDFALSADEKTSL